MLIKIIKNIFNSLKVQICVILTRRKFRADSETIKTRITECRKCEHYDNNGKFLWKAKQEKCKECGCYLKIKTKLEYEICPINKW